jgi:small subunit ribosomal protein S20
MPNKDNAKKALRQAKKRAILNLEYKDKFKDAIKAVTKAASKEDALKLVRLAQKALDKAAKHGTIKKNTAARKLSRLMKKINQTNKKTVK